MKKKLRSGLAVLALTMLGLSGARAQSPGGVATDLTFWFKPESGVGLTSGKVSSWTDQTSNSFTVTPASATSGPSYDVSGAGLINFNPSLGFAGGDHTDGLRVANGLPALTTGVTSFQVLRPTENNNRWSFQWGVNGNAYYNNYGYCATDAFGTWATGQAGCVSTGPAVPITNQAAFTSARWDNGGSDHKWELRLNGKLGTGNAYANALNIPSNTALEIGDVNSRTAGNDFAGGISEVIGFTRRVTDAERQRIESYLAIKYGITYMNDGYTDARNYVSSSGATLWDASLNSGFNNNIGGIVRDDASGLVQKQSRSSNDGKQVIIGLGSLANTNADNGGSFDANQQGLLWGDNGLAKAPMVALAGAGVNFRFAAIWKVQNSGGLGTVRVAWPAGLTNLKLVQSSDATIDGSDPVTDMGANTQVINGVSYNYADVTLANGEFFTFAAYVQAPGGVASPAVWLKANAGIDTSMVAGHVNGWQNFGYSGGTAGQLSQSAGTTYDYPYFGKNIHNFNPAIIDSTTNANGGLLLTNVFPDYSQRPLSTFVLQSQPDVSQQRVMLSFGNNINFQSSFEYPWFASQSATQLYFWWDGSYQGAPVLPNSLKRYNNIPSINSYYRHQWTSNPDTTTLSMNGGTTTLIGNSNGSLGIGNHLYINADGGNNNPSGGNISEIVSYDRDLTSEEKQRVNSYLAIKYGITLLSGDGLATTDYLNSSAAKVWDITSNAGYNNNIAGIARDEIGGLFQKQSSSVNAGQQVLIGTTGLAGTNAANTGTFGDGQFLIWGDNGLSKAPGDYNAGLGHGVNVLFNAIWKAQNTGNVGTVRVAWPAGLNNLSLVQSADATIDGSDVFTSMVSNTKTINGVTYNYADVTLANGQYFTFAGYLTGPGGVGVDLSLWYKADSGVEVDANKKVTGWNNSAASDVKLTMSSATGYIPYNDQTTFAKTWNFNPTLSFDGTNNYLRNNTSEYLNTNGSVHYITVARLNQSAAGFNSIFAIAGNDDGFFLYPQSDLVYPMPAISNGYNANAAGPGGENRFGIYSAILPKTGSPANQRGFYNGLQKVYTSPYPIVGGSYTLPTTGAYVGADGTTGDNPNGDIAEVILYHEPAGGDMDNADLAKIHSYLAIKYGITLDQSAAQNYVNSAGSVVWSAATNTGYQHNIAGIARDNEASLYQKQSWSVNAGQQVLIGTTGLENTNQANTVGLNNGQFLIWGDNGQTKAPGAYNPGLGNGVNVLFKAIWKVQNTGSVGTVRVAWPAGLNNLSLVQSGDATIDGSDVFTSMAFNSQTINGVTYNYADVTLSDGQYFTFATLVQNAPGGVFSGLSQWYRADMSIANTGDATDVTTWTDVASGIVASQITGVDLPKFKTGAADYLNFNPGVNFTATNQTIGNLTVQTLSAQQYDVFTMTKEGIIPGGNGRIFSSLASNAFQTGSIAYWDGLGINAANSVERVNTAYNYRYLANPGNVDWSTNSPSIMYHTFTNTSVAKGLNGAKKGATATHPAIGDFNGGYTIGTTQFPGNGSDNAGFIGHIGELVVYGSGNITAFERNKVDSYLAVKYGVTLSDTVNYITSAGDTVWNAAANTGFYKNVAGLGRDNISALHQKQSRSQHANTNNQVTIGLGQIAATNQANPGTIADGQFILWGDNGLTQAMTNSASTYTGFTYNAPSGTDNGRRMTRTWKVQNTAMRQQVLIRFPQASVGNTTFPDESCGQFVLLLANDQGFTTARRILPLTQNGTDYEARYSFPAGVSYFTFAKVNQWAPGIVTLPAVVTTAPDFSTCASDGWNYAKLPAATDKYFAINGMTPAQLGNIDVIIDPVGTEFNGTIHTKLMPRVTTVTDAGAGTYTGVKVRVYFSQSEMDATAVPDAKTNGWFKFEGDADAARADIDADGLLNPAKAISLTPSDSGVEDGVNYVEFDNVNTFSSFVYVSTTNESALPVRLVRFDAARKGSSAQLTWETAQESGNKGFEIQRGTTGSNWQTIGFVGGQTADGNSSSLLRYSFADETPLAGKNYYRLKQLDWDGSTAFSKIEVVDFSAANRDLVLYPNPVAGGAITLDLPESGVLEVKIYNLSGIQVKAFKQSSRVLDVKGLSSGKYVLKTVSENGQVYEKTFIIP